MVISFLTQKNLKEFIKDLKISDEDKNFFLEAIPEMDLEERKELFKTLLNIYYLDRREEEALKRIKKYLKQK